ncbi:MAG: redox-sensing transcriptional repressor Rex [Mariniblastus sp.]|nr:redox-sensing transcriptional repressor Rex [Mariniblastus sp.]
MAKSNSESGVPKAVVSRLSLYLRELQVLVRDDKKTISSTKLGRLLGVTDAQVRKDFAYFGQFGYPGIGYRCEELIQEIRGILGTDRMWLAAMIGCGNLGQALLGYRGFQSQGFSVQAAFDIAPEIVGSTFHGLKVHHLDSLPGMVEEKGIQLAILAVPAEVAADVAELLVQSGVSGVLNFAPVTLNLPKSVSVVGVDLAMELEQLAFAVVKKGEK